MFAYTLRVLDNVHFSHEETTEMLYNCFAYTEYSEFPVFLFYYSNVTLTVRLFFQNTIQEESLG